MLLSSDALAEAYQPECHAEESRHQADEDDVHHCVVWLIYASLEQEGVKVARIGIRN